MPTVATVPVTSWFPTLAGKDQEWVEEEQRRSRLEGKENKGDDDDHDDDAYVNRCHTRPSSHIGP